MCPHFSGYFVTAGSIQLSDFFFSLPSSLVVFMFPCEEGVLFFYFFPFPNFVRLLLVAPLLPRFSFLSCFSKRVFPPFSYRQGSPSLYDFFNREAGAISSLFSFFGFSPRIGDFLFPWVHYRPIQVALHYPLTRPRECLSLPSIALKVIPSSSFLVHHELESGAPSPL